MKRLICFTSLFIMMSSICAFAQERVWYTLKKGDFLLKVAERYGTTVEELHRLNPKIKNVNKVFEGQRIRLIDRNLIEESSRRAAAKKKAELAKKEEADRLAEEKRKAAELRHAQELVKAEEERKAREARLAELARLEELERQKELAKKAEEERLAELARLAEEQKKAELARKAELAKKAEEEALKRAQARLNKEMYIAVKGYTKIAGDIEAMEVAPIGFGGGIELNTQISKWFAFSFAVDSNYAEGNKKGINAKAVGVSVRPYLLLQPAISLNQSGIQPYIGIGPTYSASIQNIYLNIADNCDITKHRLGIGAAIGFNYIYKDFLFGVNLEYNYVIPISKDDTLRHLDLTSGFNAGIRLGYRF